MRALVLIAAILIATHASAYERFMSPDQHFEAYTAAAAADGTGMKLFLRRAQTHDAGVLLWENARWIDAKWSPDSRFLAVVDHMDGHIADVYVFGVTAADTAAPPVATLLYHTPELRNLRRSVGCNRLACGKARNHTKKRSARSKRWDENAQKSDRTNRSTANKT